MTEIPLYSSLTQVLSEIEIGIMSKPAAILFKTRIIFATFAKGSAVAAGCLALLYLLFSKAQVRLNHAFQHLRGG